MPPPVDSLLGATVLRKPPPPNRGLGFRAPTRVPRHEGERFRVRVQGSEIGVSGFEGAGFRAAGFGVSPHHPRQARRSSVWGCRIPTFVFRVSRFIFQGFGMHPSIHHRGCSYFVFHVSGFGFTGFKISGFQGFVFRVSGFTPSSFTGDAVGIGVPEAAEDSYHLEHYGEPSNTPHIGSLLRHHAKSQLWLVTLFPEIRGRWHRSFGGSYQGPMFKLRFRV